jgi:hypothetical protein
MNGFITWGVFQVIYVNNLIYLVERNNDSTIVFAGERLTDVESDADTDTENIFAREHIFK